MYNLLIFSLPSQAGLLRESCALRLPRSQRSPEGCCCAWSQLAPGRESTYKAKEGTCIGFMLVLLFQSKKKLGSGSGSRFSTYDISLENSCNSWFRKKFGSDSGSGFKTESNYLFEKNVHLLVPLNLRIPLLHGSGSGSGTLAFESYLLFALYRQEYFS
jgi:hypothetical protein